MEEGNGLIVYTLVDGVERPMMVSGETVVLREYSYVGERMGSRSLSAELRFPVCLDSHWTGQEFVTVDFDGGGRFFVQGIPDSYKDSSDSRYVHNLELQDERTKLLNSIYFRDSSKLSFSFFGDLQQLASRLNTFFSTSLPRFRIVIDQSADIKSIDTVKENHSTILEQVLEQKKDDASSIDSWDSISSKNSQDSSKDLSKESSNGIEQKLVQDNAQKQPASVTSTEQSKQQKLLSFERKTLWESITYAYEEFGVPFYFEGDTIHFGEEDLLVSANALSYGSENQLIKIGHTDSGDDIITRITGVGGERNLPYYYPNSTPVGNIVLSEDSSIEAHIAEPYRLANALESTQRLRFRGNEIIGSYAELYLEAENISLNMRPLLSIKSGQGSLTPQSVSIDSQLYRLAPSRSVKNVSGDPGSIIDIFSMRFPPVKGIFKGRLSGGFEGNIKILFINEFSPTNLGEDALFYAPFPNANYKQSDSRYYNSGPRIARSVEAVCLMGFDMQVSEVRMTLELGSKTYSVSISRYETIKSSRTNTLSAVSTVTSDNGLRASQSSPRGSAVDNQYFYSDAVQGISVNIKEAYEQQLASMAALPYADVEGNITVECLANIVYKVPWSQPHTRVSSYDFSELEPASIAWTCHLNVSSDKAGWTVVSKLIDSTTGQVSYIPTNKSISDISQIGITLLAQAHAGDILGYQVTQRLPFSTNLLPPYYREDSSNSDSGSIPWYDALNTRYPIPLSPGEYYFFENQYNIHDPKEWVVDFEDIYPTLQDGRNTLAEDAAFDSGFNPDEAEEKGNTLDYRFNRFYLRLPPLGFNLFDCALETGEMTLEMSSGDCGACKFVIIGNRIGSDRFRNPVLVDENGHLLRDAEGKVILRDSSSDGQWQAIQQDTTSVSVWIAVQVDSQTYGTNMPAWYEPMVAADNVTVRSGSESVEAGLASDGARILNIDGRVGREKQPSYAEKSISGHGLKPRAGDTFFFSNILLPQSLIYDAEERLKEALIRHMWENNSRKLSYNIAFSRIFLAQNPEIRERLSTHSKLYLEYPLTPATEEARSPLLGPFYITQYSYRRRQAEALPEISVEIAQVVERSSGGLARRISEAVDTALHTSVNTSGIGTQEADARYLSKERQDSASQTITFDRGIRAGRFVPGKGGEGAAISIDTDNQSYLEVDYALVRKQMTVTQTIVDSMKHVGGSLLLTRAAMVCSAVDEVMHQGKDVYRCFFSTEQGRSVENMFEAEDLARCQEYNVEGSRMWWRLVVEVGEDYILLSKDDCMQGSDTPMVGDHIVQLGNRAAPGRQSAIILDSSSLPSIRVYEGINDYLLPEAKMTTCLQSGSNKFTGEVTITGGSGASSLSDLGESIDGRFAQAFGPAFTQAFDEIELGTQNLLRNSAFTGDFLSQSLTDDVVLDEASQMYNPPLAHWDSTNAEVVDEPSAEMGKKCVLHSSASLLGSISQMLYTPLKRNSVYSLSFKYSGSGVLSYGSEGQTSEEVVIDSESITIRTGDYDVRAISFLASPLSRFEIWDIMLVSGNKPMAWAMSPLDNQSDRAYYESLKYLADAINKGSTNIAGGLILSNIITLRDHSGVTAGMSGIASNASSVAFWAGGDWSSALATASKYSSDPLAAPQDTDTKAVITHGGLAVLSDAVVRGDIYASKGRFGIFEIGDNGKHVESINAEAVFEYEAQEHYSLLMTPNQIFLNGDDVQSVSIAPFPNNNLCVTDDNAAINVYNIGAENAHRLCIHTDGPVEFDGGIRIEDKRSGKYFTNLKCCIVSELPSNPDEDTLYIVV